MKHLFLLISAVDITTIKQTICCDLNSCLPKEHKNFFYNLSFDKRGAPIYNRHVAGIDACYEAIPI